MGGEEESGPVRKSVLKDLGNKFTGDEMDTIARTASHQYYLRSLDQPLHYPGPPGPSDQLPSSPPPPPPLSSLSKKPVPIGNTAPIVTTVCPYVIPKPHLLTTPTPRGNTASDYYDVLDARDADIRKGENVIK